MNNRVIPVIDMFAGPGGLGEGFARFSGGVPSGPLFDIRLSIEKDFYACKTLELRAFFREFPKGQVPEGYYDYVRSPSPSKRNNLMKEIPEGQKAINRVWHAELGSESFPDDKVNKRIKEALGESKTWVLIGGPPCQAYSIAGRSRRSKQPREEFENLKEQRLYTHYLKIIRNHEPTVFIMENVRGILTSKISKSYIFTRICDDLESAGYSLYPLAQYDDSEKNGKSAEKYLVRSEQYGIPQRRHRVFILGIKKSISIEPEKLKPYDRAVSVLEVIGDLPSIRSGISRRTDSDEEWLQIIKTGLSQYWFGLNDDINKVFENFNSRLNRGGEFVENYKDITYRKDWFTDHRLGGVLNHSTRGHIPDDIKRYLFVSIFGRRHKFSPLLKDFPAELLPDHKNVNGGSKEVPFDDRFRVQLYDLPSTTITCHISKDGHYYIHPDPLQCRSFTVREAARIQTFPDNYFFEGPRTEQYRQVGNAVPPLLAIQIADIVYRLLQKGGQI